MNEAASSTISTPQKIIFILTWKFDFKLLIFFLMFVDFFCTPSTRTAHWRGGHQKSVPPIFVYYPVVLLYPFTDPTTNWILNSDLSTMEGSIFLDILQLFAAGTYSIMRFGAVFMEQNILGDCANKRIMEFKLGSRVWFPFLLLDLPTIVSKWALLEQLIHV